MSETGKNTMKGRSSEFDRDQLSFPEKPVYLGPVYLEKQSRIHALGYVFILVLLIASYLEYRVRKSLQETG